MLKMEDHLYGHHFYVAAACGTIRTYLALHDKPEGGAAAGGAGVDADSGLTPAERKKAESKRKKAEAKARVEAEERAKLEANVAAAAAKVAKKKGAAAAEKKPADEDPDGAKLAGAEDKLEAASVFLRTLQIHGGKEVDTHALGCELATRKKKYLLALKSLRNAVALAPDDARVHKAAMRLFLAVEADGAIAPTVRAVIDANRAAVGVPVGTSPAQMNDAYSARAVGSSAEGARAACAVVEAAQLMGAPPQGLQLTARKLVAQMELAKLPLPEAVALHQLLAETIGDASGAADWLARAAKRFPLATYFGAKGVVKPSKEEKVADLQKQLDALRISPSTQGQVAELQKQLEAVRIS